MRQLSKAYKAEHYDRLAAEKDKLDLAMFDLINGAFTAPVVLKEKDYNSKLDCAGTMSMRLSFRALPLFLVEWKFPINDHLQFTVYSEDELEQMCRESSFRIAACQMMRDAFYQLKREHYPKAA